MKVLVPVKRVIDYKLSGEALRCWGHQPAVECGIHVQPVSLEALCRKHRRHLDACLSLSCDYHLARAVEVDHLAVAAGFAYGLGNRRLVDAKDEYTRHHSTRVTEFSMKIAASSGMAIRASPNPKVARIRAPIKMITRTGIKGICMRIKSQTVRESSNAWNYTL